MAQTSEQFDFNQTDYYEPTMGRGLKKVFWAFERPFDPAELADVKLLTNRWEEDFAQAAQRNELFVDDTATTITDVRPLNLDPGYITPAKLVLASTKDFAHRIYLRDGIFAEVTLFYRHGRWEHHEWTFPDYRRGDYHEFFTRVREHLRRGGS
jgi:hypothetical protein